MPRSKPVSAAIPSPAIVAPDPFKGKGNPFANKSKPAFAGFEPGALGSLAVLGALIAGLGYGGWIVVQEIQRVQIAPVEQAPQMVAELDPLAPAVPDLAAPDTSEFQAPSQDALTRLYRPQALDAPILTARDAPISTITPGAFGALAPVLPSEYAVAEFAPDVVNASISSALAEAMGAQIPDTAAPPRVLAQAPDAVVLMAVRPAWVRVRNAEGDTLFEKVLEPGETYELPAGGAPATLRTGNSGAIYMSVAGQTYGPVAPGAQVVNATIAAADVVETFMLADLEQDTDLARVVAELTLPPADGPPEE